MLPGWRRIVALFGAGVGLVFVFVIAGAGLRQIATMPAQVALMLVLFTGVLLPLSFSEQRLRRSCLEAVAVGTGVTVPLFALAALNSDRGPAGLVGLVVSFALIWLVCVLLCLVIRLVGLWFVRSYIRRLVVQTGSLCRTCAYDLTGNESGVCPECGERI